MFELIVGAAVAAAADQRIGADPPRPSVIAVRTLEALPSVTMRHYDVTGASLSDINASIAARAPRDPASNAVSVSSSDWGITVSLAQRVSDGRCEITAADVRFTAAVLLPRLMNEHALANEQREVWNQYLGNLKASAAAELWFVHDRLDRVEQAIMTSNCNTASRAAEAAAEKIKQELTKFARVSKKPAPTFRVPMRDVHDPRS